MADQHRYYEDAQRGGRRDGPDRNEPQSWGHDGGRQQDSSRESGRGDQRYAGGPDWQQDRSSSRHGGGSFYGPSESGGRQWGQRDDRGVADYSGGWSEGGRQYHGDWSSQGSGGQDAGGGRGADFESRGGFQPGRTFQREGGFGGGYGGYGGPGDGRQYGREEGRPDYGYSGERSGLAGGYGGGRQQFSGYGQPVSQGEGFGQRPAGSGLSYAGRGPKNYQRSDDRIREEISDRMTDDDQLDASEISVQVQKCEVTLTGTVSSREQKRRAEDLAEAISGVREVTNNLRVHRPDQSEHGLQNPLGLSASASADTSSGTQSSTQAGGSTSSRSNRPPTSG
jgi:hypothetical protein